MFLYHCQSHASNLTRSAVGQRQPEAVKVGIDASAAAGGMQSRAMDFARRKPLYVVELGGTWLSKLFSEILKEDLDNTELKLYKGFSLMETNQFQEATTTLKPIAFGNSSYKYTAIWYLVLNNLKQEKYLECKELIHQLPQEFNQYKKAQKLLKDLPK